jgi:hypothetical protein
MTMRHRRRQTERGRFAADGPPKPASSRSGSREKAPIPPHTVEALRQGRAAAEAVQLARARCVGRDRGVVSGSDFGPGIRLDAIRSHDGVLLREADVTVGDARRTHTRRRSPCAALAGPIRWRCSTG